MVAGIGPWPRAIASRVEGGRGTSGPVSGGGTTSGPAPGRRGACLLLSLRV